jgi:hypothetical protein
MTYHCGCGQAFKNWRTFYDHFIAHKEAGR